jgi:hypothetical protein
LYDHNVCLLDDLRIPLATCLEALHGERAGQCSIRIHRLSTPTALNLAINRELARA